jgi:4-hydroxy-3-polyprenylbenzoate decarboxylase
VITCAPDDPDDINVGIYRMQVLGPNRVIMRWLAHRGGARHHRMWQKLGRDMPVAVAIGADPATILAAVMPLPEGMNELAFAGMLRRRRTEVATGRTVPLPVPAHAEIVLEGHVSASETAYEGPYGDHTGYYNSVEPFPVMTLSAITTRDKPIYLSTYTGRPPDEPSRLGEAMTPLFAPLARRLFPEIRDLWLPPEACSYRAMVVSIDKRYPGQARRLMLGLWSMLPQFSYTKLIIAVDGDIDVCNWSDVMRALATRFDAPRGLVVVPDTPIDYLDFASAQPGFGGRLGLDVTNKIGSETSREWGRVLAMTPEVTARGGRHVGRSGPAGGRGMTRVVVAMTGASGAAIGLRVLELLRTLPGIETHLVLSAAAERHWRMKWVWGQPRGRVCWRRLPTPWVISAPALPAARLPRRVCWWCPVPCTRLAPSLAVLRTI